jgi:hypothetical protein
VSKPPILPPNHHIMLRRNSPVPNDFKLPIYTLVL